MIHSLASKNSKIYQQYHKENNTSFKRWHVGVQISQNSFSFCFMIAAIQYSDGVSFFLPAHPISPLCLPRSPPPFLHQMPLDYSIICPAEMIMSDIIKRITTSRGQHCDTAPSSLPNTRKKSTVALWRAASAISCS